jgi:hypothetical protein
MCIYIYIYGHTKIKLKHVVCTHFIQKPDDPFLSFKYIKSNCYFKYHQVNIKKSKPKFLPTECRNLLCRDLTEIMFFCLINWPIFMVENNYTVR